MHIANKCMIYVTHKALINTSFPLIITDQQLILRFCKPGGKDVLSNINS